MKDARRVCNIICLYIYGKNLRPCIKGNIGYDLKNPCYKINGYYKMFKYANNEQLKTFKILCQDEYNIYLEYKLLGE